MRLIITGVSIDEKEVSILDHKLHKIVIDITADDESRSLIDLIRLLVGDALSALEGLRFKRGI